MNNIAFTLVGSHAVSDTNLCIRTLKAIEKRKSTVPFFFCTFQQAAAAAVVKAKHRHY